jgi:polyisoprenoid-binding protein YceI
MQTRRIIVIGIIVAGIIGAVAAAYIWFSGGSGEASQEISSQELTASGTEQVIFRIVPEESEVRFVLSEVLRGQPATVIGRTNQVASDIAVDFENPSLSEVGVVRVNARTLLTDNEFRNRTIRGQILQSSKDEFEFSQFTPTSLEGMPDAVTMGTPFTFKLAGNLQVRDIVKPVTFDVTVTPVSDIRLEGTATATVQRSDFNLEIPTVPGVADVSQEVKLEIDFVAQAVSDDSTPEPNA